MEEIVEIIVVYNDIHSFCLVALIQKSGALERAYVQGGEGGGSCCCWSHINIH